MVQHTNGERKPLSLIYPRYYTANNTYEHLGFTYRYVRDQALALGVKIIKLSNGRRWAIDAADWHAKVDNLCVQTAPIERVDPTAAVLAQLGLEVVK